MKYFVKNKKKVLLTVIVVLFVVVSTLFLFNIQTSTADTPTPPPAADDTNTAKDSTGKTPTDSDKNTPPSSSGGTKKAPKSKSLSIMEYVKAAIIMSITFVFDVLRTLFGKLLILLMKIVVWLSLYNRFIDNPYVNEGWVILRDLVNMFFILGLLFIAFVTVLKIEKQPWNKLLGRLLVMAILVNFSKTICGVIIDFFQVIMITFVNSYRDITAGNIFQGLGVIDWFAAKDAAQMGEGAGAAAVAASLFGLIFVIVSVMVILIFCVILAFRIVALWALIVFSPLAFLGWVFQGSGGKIGDIAGKWWTQFLNYCMIGPFLAFFLWLSVLTMVKLNIDQMVPPDQYSVADRDFHALESKASSMDNVIGFMLGIVMLLAGLKFSQEFAVAGAAWGNKQMGKLGQGAQGMMGKAARGYYGQKVAPVLGGMREGIGKRWQTRGGLKGATVGLARTPLKGLKGIGKGMQGVGMKEGAGALSKRIGGAGKRVTGLAKGIEKAGDKTKETLDKGRKAWAKKEAEGGVLGAGMKGVRKTKDLGKSAFTSPLSPITIPLTKEQRNFEKEQTKTRLSGYVSGDYKDRRKVEGERADEIFKMEGIDPQNMDKVKGYIDSVKKGERAYNPQMMEGALRAYSKGGKLTEPEYLDGVKEKFGFMQDRDPLEQILLDEELEKAVEDKTGYRPSFSNYIYNPQTNETEDITQLENNKKSAVDDLSSRSGISQDEIHQQLDNIDMDKLMKKKTDGTYEIEKTSEEYDTKDVQKKAVITAMEDYQGNYEDWRDENNIEKNDSARFDHGFYNLARSTEIKNKRSKERVTGISTATADQYKNFHNTSSAMSAAEHGEDAAFDQSLGAFRNIKYVSNLDERGLKNGNMKSRFMMGNNDERLSVLKENKAGFKGEIKKLEEETGKTIDTMTADDVGGSSMVQKIERKKSNLSLEDMEKAQKYIEATGARYDVDGRRLEDGKISESLKIDINERKKEEGVSGKLAKEVKSSLGFDYNSQPASVQTGVDKLVDEIDDNINLITTSTKGMSKDDKKAATIERLKSIFKNNEMDPADGSLDSEISATADSIIGMEKDVSKRSKDTGDLRGDASKDIDSIIQSMEASVASGKVDESALDFQINVVTKKVGTNVKDSGLRSKDFNVDEIKTKLQNLKSKASEMITDTTEFKANRQRFEKEFADERDDKVKEELRKKLKDNERVFNSKQKEWTNLQREIKNILRAEAQKKKK